MEMLTKFLSAITTRVSDCNCGFHLKNNQVCDEMEMLPLLTIRAKGEGTVLSSRAVEAAGQGWDISFFTERVVRELVECPSLEEPKE